MWTLFYDAVQSDKHFVVKASLKKMEPFLNHYLYFCFTSNFWTLWLASGSIVPSHTQMERGNEKDWRCSTLRETKSLKTQAGDIQFSLNWTQHIRKDLRPPNSVERHLKKTQWFSTLTYVRIIWRAVKFSICDCSGLNSVPLSWIHIHAELQNGTSFENGVFKDIIRDCYGLMWTGRA